MQKQADQRVPSSHATSRNGTYGLKAFDDEKVWKKENPINRPCREICIREKYI